MESCEPETADQHPSKLQTSRPGFVNAQLFIGLVFGEAVQVQDSCSSICSSQWLRSDFQWTLIRWCTRTTDLFSGFDETHSELRVAPEGVWWLDRWTFHRRFA